VLGLDLLSFRDAKRAIEVAALEGRCSFVVNRASRSEITPNDVERVFGQPPIAVIPSDRAVGRAQDHGRLVPMRGRIGRALDGSPGRCWRHRESDGCAQGRSADRARAADRPGGCPAARRDATGRAPAAGAGGGALSPARAGPHAAAERARGRGERGFGCGRRDGSDRVPAQGPRDHRGDGERPRRRLRGAEGADREGGGPSV
jgi:hypothetical protein